MQNYSNPHDRRRSSPASRSQKQAKKYVDLAISELDSRIHLGHNQEHEDRDCKIYLIQNLNSQSRVMKQALERLEA